MDNGFKEITIRVFEVRNTMSQVRKIRADAGKIFWESHVKAIVETILANLSKARDGHKYEAIKVGPANYNFVWNGYT
jgi:hypothetical protein